MKVEKITISTSDGDFVFDCSIKDLIESPKMTRKNRLSISSKIGFLITEQPKTQFNHLMDSIDEWADDELNQKNITPSVSLKNKEGFGVWKSEIVFIEKNGCIKGTTCFPSNNDIIFLTDDEVLQVASRVMEEKEALTFLEKNKANKNVTSLKLVPSPSRKKIYQDFFDKFKSKGGYVGDLTKTQSKDYFFEVELDSKEDMALVKSYLKEKKINFEHGVIGDLLLNGSLTKKIYVHL
jgi:hypothetical protein